MNIVGLSGWLQPEDTLRELVSGIEVLRYDALADMRALTKILAAKQPEVVIGWSLGGVLAVQALQHPQYRPRKLVLLGSPFRYLASEEVPEGVTEEVYQALHRDYQDNPKHLAKRLQLAINAGLAPETSLCPLVENYYDTKAWLPWLEHLAAASFVDAQFAYQPEVLVIYGQKDAIISPAQGKYWPRIFPQAQVVVIPEASHAPHIQAREVVQQMVTEFIHA